MYMGLQNANNREHWKTVLPTMQSPILLTKLTGYDSKQLEDCVRFGLSRMSGVFERLRGNSQPLIVVKPNWIQESHENKPDVWEPVITHPELVLAIIAELARSIDGRGCICLCDAPHTYANFEGIVARGNLKTRFESLREKWPKLDLELIDLRREVWIRREEVVVERRANQPDPRGYVRLNLGRDSLFFNHSGCGRFYGADYDSSAVNEHHRGDTHEYLLAGTPVKCDLFVNVPKLKTHKKTGITCCLKNLVGINGDKNWLPHHTEGAPANGGDEFPEELARNSLERTIKKAGRKVALAIPGVGTWAYRKARNAGKLVLGDSDSIVRNGNWQGNDTCWRMALDLNRALLYGNSDGTWRERGHSLNYLAIVDGITGGEGNGPLCPEPVQSNVLVFGENPAAIDAVAAKLMGFDPVDIPIVRHAFDTHRWPISKMSFEDVRVTDQRVGTEIKLNDLKPAIAKGFRPHFGWSKLRRID
jgi:uncharacterized protein (DUF362 family)